MIAHVVGVDPGLVHTGVVRLVFDQGQRALTIETEAVAGPNGPAVRAFVDEGSRRLLDQLNPEVLTRRPATFIEDYRPRSHFDTDAQMGKAVRDIKACVPWASVLNNTGVKKVVTDDLLKALQLWRFAQVTNHQDLRSAARIALLGMFKDEQLNEVVADMVRDHLDGRPWDVEV